MEQENTGHHRRQRLRTRIDQRRKGRTAQADQRSQVRREGGGLGLLPALQGEGETRVLQGGAGLVEAAVQVHGSGRLEEGQERGPIQGTHEALDQAG